MTEEDARALIEQRFGTATVDRLQQFAALLLAEAARQNLIAASTIENLWVRHLLDSAQLVSLAPDNEARWLDIGSGAGLPGIVIALLTGRAVTLVEPRRRRAEFLAAAVTALDLAERTTVVARKVEAVTGEPFGVVSARAVASLPALLAASAHLTNRRSVWLLPRGRSAETELEVARATWHGEFHVERSLTDPTSWIVIAHNVRPR